MKFHLSLFILMSLSITAPAWACDPCALYTASRLQGSSENTLTLSLSEQYTSFNRSSGTAENSIRNGEFVEGFSTSQLAASYGVTENLGLQLTLPVVVRRVEAIERFRSSTRSDSGIGDLSLVGNYSFINRKQAAWTIVAGLFGGVKLPTGDTGVLEEVSREEQNRQPKHHQIGSISGGRALTFGTGSYDFISGLNFLGRYERYLLLSGVQYTLKTEGDFNYEFADDFLYSLVPAYYFLLRHDLSVAGGISFTGEFKGEDHLNNALVAGSGISNLYLGPDILITFGDKYGAELGVDFRVSDEDQGATVVPEMRFRASISYRF